MPIAAIVALASAAPAIMTAIPSTVALFEDIFARIKGDSRTPAEIKALLDQDDKDLAAICEDIKNQPVHPAPVEPSV